MSSAAYYRAEALRCREFAKGLPDAPSVKRWLQLALEYEQLADNLAAAPTGSGMPHVQQVAMQQQRLKNEPDEKP
jgi:hypothetical protein